MSKRLSDVRVRLTYEFIKANQASFGVRTLCGVLGVAPSRYYAWLKQPLSSRAQEDARLLRLIRASFTASHGFYGAPRVFVDLREAGETCSKTSRASNAVARKVFYAGSKRVVESKSNNLGQIAFAGSRPRGLAPAHQNADRPVFGNSVTVQFCDPRLRAV